MKLISLADFVLQENTKGVLKYKNDIEAIRKYAEFLQQELTLSMFLPCDKNGNILKEPEWWYRYNCGASPFMNVDEILPCQEYKKAVSNVIFNPVSFDNVKGQADAKFYSVGETQVFNLSDDDKRLYWHHYTIESLLSEFDETIMINFLV